MNTPGTDAVQWRLPDQSSRLAPIESWWNLRFKTPELEDRYLYHLVERDRKLTRYALGITLYAGFFLCLADLRHLPAHTPTLLIISRVPIFFLCWLAWMAASFLPRFTPRMPIFTALYATLAVCVLCSSQWVSGHYGYLHSYQLLLLLTLFTPLVGGIPWRYAVWPCLLSAILLAVPEWLYQPDATLCRMHTIYIALTMMVSLFSSHTLERVTRHHFLINNTFLEQSRHDALTGLPNRRDLQTLLTCLIRQATREQASLAVAMIDVDHFKRYNDHYGHAAGDNVLATVAHAIARQASPKPDYVARYGGEEFIAVWFQSQQDVLTLGEGLRRAVELTNIEHTASPHGKITASVGITCHVPMRAEDSHKLLDNADRALYLAKESGRNLVCTHVCGADKDAPSAPAGAKPFEPGAYIAALTPRETAITREDRARFASLRGIIEQPQLVSMLIVTLIINLTLIAANLVLPDAPASMLLVSSHTFFLTPLLCSGIALTRHEWAQRLSWRILPLFILAYGLIICYAAWLAFQRQGDIPYELLMLLIFQNYMVGSQHWGVACVVGWTITLTYLVTRIICLPTGDLPHVLISFVLVNCMGVALSAIQDHRRLDSFVKQEKLKFLAQQDALTGLANRQGLDNYLASIRPLLPCARNQLTAAMIDVDWFKHYNDHYGHTAGDAVLAAVGQAIGKHAGQRPYDFCARYGGEEFLLFWYQCKHHQAALFGERIRAAVEALQLPHEKSPYGHITVSIGIVSGDVLGNTEQDGSIHALIQQADAMLYRAKNAGRNRVFSRFEADEAAPATNPADGQNCTPTQAA